MKNCKITLKIIAIVLFVIYKISILKVSDEFCIENRESVEEKIVQIDISNFSIASCPFSIQWSAGEKPTVNSDCIRCTLQKGERSGFLLSFQPKSQGSYSVEAPIFIRNELNGQMFNKLCLVGEYPASTIKAEFSEIFFAPVPLNTSLEKKFRLCMRHFEKDVVILSNIMPPEYSSGKYTENVLLINFIDTNIVPASE